MTLNHFHCGHFVLEAVRQRLGTGRTEGGMMFGVPLEEYMAKQIQAISFMYVPFLVRFCVDDIVHRGTKKRIGLN